MEKEKGSVMILTMVAVLVLSLMLTGPTAKKYSL